MVENVNYPTAKFFYDQCVGNTSGHMAMIPNTPILQSLALAHGVETEEEFAAFLRYVADWLDGGGK